MTKAELRRWIQAIELEFDSADWDSAFCPSWKGKWCGCEFSEWFHDLTGMHFELYENRQYFKKLGA